MATRTISTKLVIDGESQYRSSIANINSELKKMQSALKLTESQYQTNANSLQALQAKHDALSKVQEAQRKKVEELRKALDNARQAESTYAKQKEDLQKKIEANNKALENLKKSTGDTTKEEARLNEENQRLQKELEGVDAKLSAAQKGVNSWETQLNSAQIQLNNTDAELQKNDKYLDEAAKSTDGCAHSIDEFGKEVHESSEELKTMGTILASDELRAGMKKIIDVLSDCTQSFMDFETGMAGVKRTTGVAGPELEELGDYFKKLSTEIPITTQELTSIATTAGQLGISGKEKVQQFTEVMAKLATTTDLTADTAATMLAQFANITHVDDYERLGALVAALGDSTATTATKVVEMSQGLAAAASVAGMSERDIMAISAAVGSLGIESAAGSTAMSTLISTLYKATETGDKLSDFASVAGMSASEFRHAWQDDAVGALNAFISGLNDTERNGASAIVLLEELGITNVRQTKAILGLAEAGDLLTGTIDMANKAWEENTALDEKAAVMFDTMKAKMTTLENSTDNLEIAVGEALAPAILKLADSGQSVIEGVTKFVEANPNLVEALGVVAGSVAAITTAIAGAKAAYKALDFLGMAGPLKTISEAAAGAGGGIAGLTSALGAIAIPAAAAASALLGVVTVIERIKETETTGFIGEGHTLEEYADNVEKYREELDKLKEEYDNLKLYGGDLTMAQDALDMATISLQHATEEYEAAQEAANQAVEEGSQVTEAHTAAQEAAAAAAEDISIALVDIAEAYQESYEEARKSLDGQIKLFDDFSAEVAAETDTASEMLQHWAQQTANLAMYTENLEKAAAYGLDDGLVRSLADGSTESAGYLYTIIQEIEKCANGTGTLGTSAEEAVSKFNASFQKTEEAKDNLAETMTAINTGLADSLAEMERMASDVNFDGFWDAVDNAFSTVGVDFEEIGLNMGTGLKQGINSSSADVEAAAKDLSSAAENAAKEQAQEHSPSRVFEEIGANMDEGMRLGIENNSEPVVSTVRNMGERVIRVMEDSGSRSAQAFVSRFQEMQAPIQNTLFGLQVMLGNSASALEADMYTLGGNMIIGMINGVYSMNGMLSNAVAHVVINAINAAQAAADVHSPSRKTREIFENVGEGMIVGIEAKRQKVADATAGVVNDALVMNPNTIKELSQAVSSAVPDYGRILGEDRARRGHGASDDGSENGHGNTYNNKVEIVVNTLPGQNEKEIAEIVMVRMQHELERKGGAF